MFARLREHEAYARETLRDDRLVELLRAAQGRLWYHLDQPSRDAFGVPEDPNPGSPARRTSSPVV